MRTSTTEFKYSPEDFDKYVRAYHKMVEDKGDFPDLAGLKNALDIEDGEYDAMTEDPAYHKTILWSRRRRESFLNRLAITARNTNGIKMLLAQPENGGYVEKPVDKTPRKLEVVLRGMPDDDMDSTVSDDDSNVGDSGEPEPAEQEAGQKGRKSGDMSGKAVRSCSRTKRTGA
jgi:hypothetical protein